MLEVEYSPLVMGDRGSVMGKLMGYARVSTRQQSNDRQEVDLRAAGVRRDDLYIDNGVSGARASRPEFDRAVEALERGDTLVITTLDRLGRSTQNLLAFAEELRRVGAGRRVLNRGGEDADTATPMGSMLFTMMAALAQMEHEIKSERIIDSISKRRAAGLELDGREGAPHRRIVIMCIIGGNWLRAFPELQPLSITSIHSRMSQELGPPCVSGSGPRKRLEFIESLHNHAHNIVRRERHAICID